LAKVKTLVVVWGRGGGLGGGGLWGGGGVVLGEFKGGDSLLLKREGRRGDGVSKCEPENTRAEGWRRGEKDRNQKSFLLEVQRNSWIEKVTSRRDPLQNSGKTHSARARKGG